MFDFHVLPKHSKIKRGNTLHIFLRIFFPFPFEFGLTSRLRMIRGAFFFYPSTGEAAD